MKRYLYILIALAAFISCEPQLPESTDMLVIEGWIENNGAPKVFVTSSISATLQEKNITDLIDHVAMDADVTITHNGVDYKLKPSIRDEYLLKVCYTTNSLLGEVGGTYRLNVKWRGMEATAQTTIQPPGTVDSIAIVHHESIDSMYLVKVRPVPAPGIPYYMFFSMDVDKDPTYQASYMGTYDSSQTQDMIAVNRGYNNPITENIYFYSMGDSVRFKIASLEPDAYDFWCKFDEIRLFSHVALLPYSTNLTGNVQGGLGYFFGYGVNYYSTKIK